MSDNNYSVLAENISKKYRIGLSEKKYDTFAATIISKITYPINNFRKVKNLSVFKDDNNEDVIWALRDINFSLKKGEVLGIIGKNGAGKSTLLKILSRITDPTSGRITIFGRVASLLEVGTGFNPELTGRENVYLNGTILGMTKKEVDEKFKEIVDFSGVEKFIDTPVKRYSSGMRVRLAFAVAAHLDPDILVIDEVLAVGDAEFQKKCLGKMNEVAKAGRTILFVSHNLSAIRSLCSRCILLVDGKIEYDGDVVEAIDRYLTQESDMAQTGIIPDDLKRQYFSNEAKFNRVTLSNGNEKLSNQFYFRQNINVTLELQVLNDIFDALANVMVGTTDGTLILYLDSLEHTVEPIFLSKGRYRINLTIPGVLLPGNYSVYIGLSHLTGTTIDWVERVFDFSVMKTSLEKNKHYRWVTSHGYVNQKSEWTFSKISE